MRQYSDGSRGLFPTDNGPQTRLTQESDRVYARGRQGEMDQWFCPTTFR